MSTKVVLISGKAGHGKDTFALMLKQELTEKHKRSVLIMHFADLVKYTLKAVYDWNGVKDEYGRFLLQSVGTDLVRAKYPNFWIDYIYKIIDTCCGSFDFVLIPDARFENEITSAKDYCIPSMSVRINRDNFESRLSNEQAMHSSETGLDEFSFDHYIENNGTMTQLTLIANKFCKDVLI